MQVFLVCLSTSTACSLVACRRSSAPPKRMKLDGARQVGVLLHSRRIATTSSQRQQQHRSFPRRSFSSLSDRTVPIHPRPTPPHSASRRHLVVYAALVVVD